MVIAERDGEAASYTGGGAAPERRGAEPRKVLMWTATRRSNSVAQRG